MRLGITVFCLAFSSMFADIHLSSQPWIENFLETKASVFAEQVKTEKKCTHQGVFQFSTSPYPECQTDVLIAGNSIKTGKAAIRAEKLVFSDLEGEPFALSFVGEVSKSRETRVRNPAFFEMAKNCLEVGVGAGKHLCVRKEFYTQVFSYLFGGVGTQNASWAQVEVGVQHVLYESHFLRVSFSHVHSFGKDRSFLGFGTIRSRINNISFTYQYRFLNELDLIISLAKRYVDKGPIRSAQVLSLGVSYPISW